MCRSFVLANDFPNCAATGDAYRVPIPFQFVDFYGKGTSLASCITVPEMLQTTKQIVAVTYESLLLYAEVGLIYLIISTILTKLQSIGEKKLNFYGRKEG